MANWVYNSTVLNPQSLRIPHYENEGHPYRLQVLTEDTFAKNIFTPFLVSRGLLNLNSYKLYAGRLPICSNTKWHFKSLVIYNQKWLWLSLRHSYGLPGIKFDSGDPNNIPPNNRNIWIPWYSEAKFRIWVQSSRLLVCYSGHDRPSNNNIMILIPDQSCYSYPHCSLDILKILIANMSCLKLF